MSTTTILLARFVFAALTIACASICGMALIDADPISFIVGMAGGCAGILISIDIMVDVKTREIILSTLKPSDTIGG